MLLDRPYTISGRVLHGRKLGRSLGFPTLNLKIEHSHPALQGILRSGFTALPNGRSLAWPASAYGRRWKTPDDGCSKCISSILQTPSTDDW